MKDAIRVVLVDPIDDSPRAAPAADQRASTAVWLAEVCTDVRGGGQAGGRGPARPGRRRPRRRPGAGHQPDPDDRPEQPGRRRPARQPDRDSSIILRVDPRRGPRVPHPARPSPTSCSRSVNRLIQPPRRRRRPAARPQGPQVIAVTGAAGGVGCTSLAVNLATTLAKTSAARGRPRRLRPDARLGRRLPRHHPRPDPAGGRPEHRPARPDAPEAVADPARLGPLRPAPPGRDGGRRQDRPRGAPPGARRCSRRRSRRSSSTRARASSRPTSSPSRWPTSS